MTTYPWQLIHPIDAVIFDCDATLSQIEGINVLAEMNGVKEAVHLLTEEAMDKTGITREIYKKRLDLVRPNSTQLSGLGKHYYDHVTPDVDHVIHIFQRLNKTVYVISAGIQKAVVDFAAQLNIPSPNIFAVDIYFDKNGEYADYDHESPMARQGGKREVIQHLKSKHKHILHIGDGMNDVEAADVVTRFVGYGGAYFREHIASLCDFYIKSRSVTPVLPLTLTAVEVSTLTGAAKKYYENGLHRMQRGEVMINGAIDA